MKNILIVLDDYRGLYPYLIKGEEPHCLPFVKYFIEYLKEKGHKIYIIYPSTYEGFIKQEKVEIYLWKRHSNPFIFRFQQFLKIYKIGKRILEKDPQITHIYATGFVSMVSSKLAQKYKKIHITRIFGVYSKFNFKLLYRFLLLCWSLKSPTHMLVITDDGTRGDEFCRKIKAFHRKFLFIRNGVDKSKLQKLMGYDYKYIREKLGLPLDSFIITNVSRLSSWKRVDLVIKSFYEFLRLLNGEKKALLLIVGYGRQFHYLKNLCKRLKIDPWVRFTGGISHEHALKYMYASDVLTSFYEFSNVGSVLLEALSLGKVVVARDEGETHKIIKTGKNGFLVGYHDEEDFTKKVGLLFKKLYNSSDLLKEIAHNAKIWSEENIWDWRERIKFEYEEILKIKTR